MNLGLVTTALLLKKIQDIFIYSQAHLLLLRQLSRSPGLLKPRIAQLRGVRVINRLFLGNVTILVDTKVIKTAIFVLLLFKKSNF